MSGLSEDLPVDNSSEEITVIESEHSLARKRRRLAEVEQRPVPNFETLKSDVYNHYSWIETDRQWKCNYCPAQYTHLAKGGSGSLGGHVKNKHGDKYQGNLKKASLHDYFPTSDRPTKPVVESITRDKFKDKLVSFLIETDQPFTLVEEESFRDFLGFCSSQNEKCSLVSDATIKNWIDDLYTIEKQELIRSLKENPSMISFILDGWTSGNQHPYQGVIACWINNDWKLCHSVIDMTILEGQHSGENMADAFESVLDEFDLWGKILALTTDNASNMKTLLECVEEKARERMIDFRVDDSWVRCLAHILNLSCKAALQFLDKQTSAPVEDSDENEESEDEDEEDGIKLKLIRRGIREIRRTPQRRQAFGKYCAKLGLPEKLLILDVPTRWNSTLAMLKRVCELKGAYIEMTKNNKDLTRYHFAEDSPTWKVFEELVVFLKPFEEATKMLSQGHSPSLSDGAAVYYFLFEHLESYSAENREKLQKTRLRTQRENDKPVWQAEASRKAWEKLQKYYAECDKLVYVVATVMDPRYKFQWFQHAWEKEFVDKAKQKITQIWKTKYSPKGDSPAAQVETTSQSEWNIATLVAENLRSFQTTEDELKRYLSEPIVNTSKLSHGVDGALDWWRIHEPDFPNLAKMARDYLAVSATGVPVERLFSSGRDIISHRRHKLSDKSVRKVMCLKQWLKNKRSKGHYQLGCFQEAVLVKAGVESEN